jgi:hypothetical protein
MFSCPLWYESCSPYNVFPLHWPVAAGSVTAAAWDGGASSCVDGVSVATGLFLSCSVLPFYLHMMKHKYDCRTCSSQILMPGHNTHSPHSSKCHPKFHWALLPDHSYCLLRKHHRYTFITKCIPYFPSYSVGIGRGVKLTIYLHLVLELRMCGVIPTIPHMPSWHHRDNVIILKIYTFSGATYWYIIIACTFNTVFHIYVLCYNLLISSKNIMTYLNFSFFC